MADELGAAKGLIGGMKFPSNGLMGGDSSKIPEAIRAIMAKRRAASTDKTPVINMVDELKSAVTNNKSYTPAQRDSIAKTFDHQKYIQHLDEIGYEVAKKKPK